jgi:hypothetical protein
MRIFVSKLSSEPRYYASRSYREKGNCVVIVGKKWDVTDEINAIISEHDAEVAAKALRDAADAMSLDAPDSSIVDSWVSWLRARTDALAGEQPAAHPEGGPQLNG